MISSSETPCRRQDMRVIEPGGDADFAEKPFGPEGGSEFRTQDFEGGETVVLHVTGEVDRGHATAPDLALHAAVLGERGFRDGESVGLFRQGAAAPDGGYRNMGLLDGEGQQQRGRRPVQECGQRRARALRAAICSWEPSGGGGYGLRSSGTGWGFAYCTSRA
jgi:hypothetical protein